MARMIACGLAIAFAVAISFSGANAQSAQVLTVDPDRLFGESETGKAALAGFETESAELATENRQIEADLIEEERDLTERRASLPPDEFRALADAFDAKVQELRTQQDAKARALIRRRDEVRQTFLAESLPVLAEIMGQRGAIVLLDRQNVFLSADAIDITDEAIRRMDARGTPAPEEGTDTTPAPDDAAPEE